MTRDDAILARQHPLWRDIACPFTNGYQPILLALICLAIFLVFARANDRGALIYTVAAWFGGMLALVSISPARLTIAPHRLHAVEQELERLRFRPSPDRCQWHASIPAWLRWPDSDVEVAKAQDRFIITGPMTTLKWLHRHICREQA
jgi:hypothetical protein